MEEPKDQYLSGDTVVASFRSANPRNNQRIEGSFLTVDLLLKNSTWQTKYVDGDWCTKYFWRAQESLLGISYADIHWQIPEETQQGIYRICHYGAAKRLLSDGEIKPATFEAPDWMTSNPFVSAFTGVLNAAKSILSISDRTPGSAHKAEMARSIKEFSGCTKSFLVKSKPGDVV